MPGHFSLQELLSKARKRELTQLVLDQSALALTIVMSGAILLLLAGTELLNWWWLTLLIVAGVGVGLWRLRRSVPSLYTLAQRIDRRLKLADALSTAFYFGKNPDPLRTAVCERQRESADAIAGEVDLQAALPFKRSRFALPAVAMLAGAFALFGVRYLVTGTMSLEPSLVRIAYDSFFSSKINDPQKQARNLRPKFVPSGADDSNSKLDQEKKEDDLSPADNPDGDPNEANDTKNGKNDQQDKASKNDKGDKGSDNKGSNQDSSDKKQDDGADKGQDQKNGDKPGNQDAKQGNNNSSGSNMMNKIKDALNNMLSKMKPQDNQQNGNDNQQDGKKGDPADKGQKSSPSKQQDSSEASSKEADNEQGDQSDQSQAGDTKKSSDKSSDSKSGAGSQDGEKALKAAAELKAIGKITELLGKRQQNVTGEVMIEVGNGKQPLKTPWAQRAANHVEAGSEIHRDEIPLTDQLFVQQYFEEVRKPAAAPSKPPAAPKTAPAGK